MITSVRRIGKERSGRFQGYQPKTNRGSIKKVHNELWWKRREPNT